MGLPLDMNEEFLMEKMDSNNSGYLDKLEWVEWWLDRYLF
jgi:hypothetical protein